MSRLPFFKKRNERLSYDFRKLIDHRNLIEFERSRYHIICDIDKTYLETKSETTLQLIKVALEDAEDKRTAGAPIFLNAVRWSGIQSP